VDSKLPRSSEPKTNNVRSFPSARPRCETSKRLGMLTPSSNTILEPVCFAMASDLPDVSLHFARFRVTEISLSPAALGQFAPEGMIEAAHLLADARVDAICWNGTSASWLGLDSDSALCRLITRETGIAATSSVLAMIEALRKAGLSRIGLVTPYTNSVQQRIAETLAAEGLEVVAERHSGLSENYAFAGVSDEALEGMLRQVAEASPQAILVLCTNLRGAPLVDVVERDTGIPVLDSVATSFLGALHLVGVAPSRIKGWGRVFSGLSPIRGDAS
jgi:maleate isomerase